MRVSFWDEYELIDASDGERLERWKDRILIRPDPQIIWKAPKKDTRWHNADAHYHRSKSGGGQWENLKSISCPWDICYRDLKFKLNIFGFKHTGIFPEQAINWDFCRGIVSKSKKSLKILNLFAYTGGASIACAKAGGNVCHVDSSKGMVAWAKENAALSNIGNDKIRWIVDDCVKFVLREKRRGNEYDGIIMDPPSFGRGSNGEIWKIEENLYELLELCESIMSRDAEFFILNSYTTGLSPAVMQYMLGEVIFKKRGGKISSDEIGLQVSSSKFILPSGSTAIWVRDKLIPGGDLK